MARLEAARGVALRPLLVTQVILIATKDVGSAASRAPCHVQWRQRALGLGWVMG